MTAGNKFTGSGNLSGPIQINIQGVPNAPTIGTASEGNLSASVAFTPPAFNGNVSITSYTITSSPGSITATGSSSPITITGLTKNTNYTFTAFATNAKGNSSNSSSSNSVLVYGVPNAPTIGIVTASDASASVSFTAPANNGGKSINSYTVTSTPGNITATGSSSPINVTGLTNGTSYTFKVKAHSIAGFGAESSASSAVTPASASSGLTISGGNNSYSDYYYNYQKFNTSGTLNVSGAGSGAYAEILVAAGGGAGGINSYTAGSTSLLGVYSGGGGGGGAGGLRLVQQLVTDGSYPIVVGAGGAAPTNNYTHGGNGSNTSFNSSIYATGGGYGSYGNGSTTYNGGSGGSGGGGSYDSGFANRYGTGNAGAYNPVEGYRGVAWGNIGGGVGGSCVSQNSPTGFSSRLLAGRASVMLKAVNANPANTSQTINGIAFAQGGPGGGDSTIEAVTAGASQYQSITGQDYFNPDLDTIKTYNYNPYMDFSSVDNSASGGAGGYSLAGAGGSGLAVIRTPRSDSKMFAMSGINSASQLQTQNGVDWSTLTMPVVATWNSVVYGNNIWIAVSSEGHVAKSTNGTTWTYVSSILSNAVDVAFGNNKFVVISNSQSRSSTDGVTWTGAVSLPSSGTNYTAIEYAPGGNFVVTRSASNGYGYSSNGTTWTAGTFTSTGTNNWTALTANRWGITGGGEGLIVAFCYNTNKMAWSTNGTSWTYVTLPVTDNWKSIAYSGGLWVAQAYNSSVTVYSTDGKTWTQGAMPNSRNWSSLSYINGKFVSLVDSSNITAYSTNGINWTEGTQNGVSTTWKNSSATVS